MNKPKTIAQYCILKWLEANFCIEELDIALKDADAVSVMDKSGVAAVAIYDNGLVYLVDEGGIA